MIKKTILLSNPCRLFLRNAQLCLEYADGTPAKTVAVEDVGVIILEDSRITLTTALLAALVENNAALVTCNQSHLPEGLMLPMFSHNTFSEKLRYHLNASLPLKKNLWQQTVTAKIQNQAALLEKSGISAGRMHAWAAKVRSGDPDNTEAHAAAYYWSRLFDDKPGFNRSREGEPPNNLLNYGYAILRAVIARSLVGSGLFPALGIHHRNKYNYWCLADDIMEPYRPFVDMKVLGILESKRGCPDLDTETKKELLGIPVMDVIIDGKSSPLMIASQRTTASLSACFGGTVRKVLYPELPSGDETE